MIWGKSVDCGGITAHRGQWTGVQQSFNTYHDGRKHLLSDDSLLLDNAHGELGDQNQNVKGGGETNFEYIQLDLRNMGAKNELS
jgi:hypothetical protein